MRENKERQTLQTNSIIKKSKQNFFLFKNCCIFFVFIFLSLERNIYPISLYFTNYFYSFENADFENYNKETFRKNQAISTKNTDDSYNLIYSELRLISTHTHDKSYFHIDMSRWSHWGADNAQGNRENDEKNRTGNGQNTIIFTQLYFMHPLSDSLFLTLGRHKYDIGNSYWDYFFSDIIDGAVLNYTWEKNLHIQFMMDTLSNSVVREDVGIYGSTNKDDEQIENFQGDTISTRIGANIHWQFPQEKNLSIDHWGLRGWRTFSYYLRYGANNLGGSDLAEDGKNSYNKADKDFLHMSGIRLYGDFFEKALSFDITWAYASGQDMQFTDNHVYNGQAGAINIIWETKMDTTFKNHLWLSGGYFHPRFASLKGRSMGGMLLWGYKRYYPSPYTSFYHFRDYAKQKETPSYVDRTNAKTFGKIKEKFQIDRFTSSLSFLGLWETQSGEYMGSEIEFSIKYNMKYKMGKLNFSQSSALYIPTNYYEKHSEKNAFLPTGKNTFYGFQFRVEYTLDLALKQVKK